MFHDIADELGGIARTLDGVGMAKLGDGQLGNPSSTLSPEHGCRRAVREHSILKTGDVDIPPTKVRF